MKITISCLCLYLVTAKNNSAIWTAYFTPIFEQLIKAFQLPKSNQSQETISVNDLIDGWYFVRIRAENVVVAKRFIRG